MVFKYHSFILGDDDELNKTRPGSPPAFFSLLSPDSPRVCGNCIPGVTAGAATSAALAATAHQSSAPVMPTQERLHQQHVRKRKSETKGWSLSLSSPRFFIGNCSGFPDTTPSDLDEDGTSEPTRNITMVGASPKNSITGHILPPPNLLQFTLAELKAATMNFRSDSLLGDGGFGEVFKGWIDDKPSSKNRKGSRTPVAVKRLSSESMQGIEEWQTEVNFLGQLSHPNLVKLLGYCIEAKELLLVYEFMQERSLEKHLFGRVGALPWDIRFKIVIGVAKGLAFLHTSEMQVIHRDIKTSNILLDGFYNAKISDFGLAKTGPSESKSQVTTSVMGTCGLAKTGPSGSKSHVTTRVMGTYGYAAPEYIATGHLSVKSDVFGFGVVLVEILTGLRAFDIHRPSGQQNLVDWMKPYLSDKRKLESLVDSQLEGKYSHSTVYKIAQLALNCLALEPNSRPSMKKVVKTLRSLNPAVPR